MVFDILITSLINGSTYAMLAQAYLGVGDIAAAETPPFATITDSGLRARE